MSNHDLQPTTEKQRFIILDALRGLALFAIILANFPEFGLWTFLSPSAQAAMPTAGIDRVVRFLQYFLIDGKGYTLFSLLFGCGFSIILQHAMERGGNGLRLFYRRMGLLLCIALAHLLLLWSGDILCLYAVAGMLLPLFHRLSNRCLLWWAGVLLFLPVVFDFIQQATGTDWAAPIERAWWATANSYGITEANFASWLHDATSYGDVSAFLMQGAVERMWEFVDGDRLPKVLGLFILGYCMGRNKLYTQLPQLRPQLQRLCRTAGWTGVPFSLAYAWDSVGNHVWGEGFHSLLYFMSVVPMAFFYLSSFCLLFLHDPQDGVFRVLAKPGRMALTNYIGQSAIGMLIYYGIGCGLGMRMGLAGIELTAVGVFVFQILFSYWWMSHFRYGPLEWVWRMLTYGKWLNPWQHRRN